MIALIRNISAAKTLVHFCIYIDNLFFFLNQKMRLITPIFSKYYRINEQFVEKMRKNALFRQNMVKSLHILKVLPDY